VAQKMTFMVDVEKMPRNVLGTAVKLNDPLKKIYVTLYFCIEPATPKNVAKKLGFARAYVHMRLCQLESMGLVKRIHDEKRVKFEPI